MTRYKQDPRDAVNDFIRDTNNENKGGKRKWASEAGTVTHLQSLKKS